MVFLLIGWTMHIMEIEIYSKKGSFIYVFTYKFRMHIFENSSQN